MATKKKYPRQDPKLVSSKDKNEGEIRYIASRFKIPIKEVRYAVKNVGRSRSAIYQWLRAKNYSIPTRLYPARKVAKKK